MLQMIALIFRMILFYIVEEIHSESGQIFMNSIV